MKKVYLGVDVGSISTNFVLLDENKELCFKSYIRNESFHPGHYFLQGR